MMMTTKNLIDLMATMTWVDDKAGLFWELCTVHTKSSLTHALCIRLHHPTVHCRAVKSLQCRLHQNALYFTTLHNNPLYFTIQHQSAGQGNKVLLLLLLLLLLVHKACCLSCTREAVFNGADHHCHIALAVKQRNSQQSFFNRFQ